MKLLRHTIRSIAAPAPLVLNLTACLAVLLIPSSTSAQQFFQEQQEPNAYDMRFLDREGHKPSNPYAMSGNDFHQHSYHRMLLNSPYAGSSIGLGANASKQIFNKDAYDYMNPQSKKINTPLVPAEFDPYVQNAYAPKMNKHYNPGYDTNKQFNQANPFGMENRFNASESPFDSNQNMSSFSTPAQEPSNPASSTSTTNDGNKSQATDQKYPFFLNPATNTNTSSNSFLFGNPGSSNNH